MDFINYALPPFIFFVLAITWFYFILWACRIWWGLLKPIRWLSFYVIGKLEDAICFAGRATSRTIRTTTFVTASCWIIAMRFTGKVVLYALAMASILCICDQLTPGLMRMEWVWKMGHVVKTVFNHA